MKTNYDSRRFFAAGGLLAIISATLVWGTMAARDSMAATYPYQPLYRDKPNHGATPCIVVGDTEAPGTVGGTWYWLRSPQEEKRVIIGLYNRYCIRCHGVDGRGIWDIPDVPDFTNPRWQAIRSDGQLARSTLEGRGACMPAFRGTLTLEEAWGMARYLRTFIPGAETPKPETKQPEQLTPPTPPAPKKVEQSKK
jgi:mono/diheme cytochrome c family protein